MADRYPAEEADARLTLLHVMELPHGLRDSPWSLAQMRA
jgi:hypothetical protein